MTSFMSTITQRKRTPEQLVVSAKVSLNAYLDGDNTAEENLGKRLAQIKLILYGDGDHPEVDEEKALEVARSVQSVSFDLSVLSYSICEQVKESYDHHMTSNIILLPYSCRNN